MSVLHFKNLSQGPEADSDYHVWFLMCLWLSSYSFLLSDFNVFVVSIKLIRVISDTIFLHKYISKFLLRKQALSPLVENTFSIRNHLHEALCFCSESVFFKVWD